MIWLWIGGGLVLAAGAVLPPLLTRRRAGRRAYADARDRAHAAMSRLEWAIDAAGDGHGGDGASGSDSATAEARRCFTLAGSALAGPDTAGAFGLAESWARRGLAALGEETSLDEGA